MLTFGIEEIAYDKNGIIDFYWPLERTEMLPVRDRLLELLIPYLKNPVVEENSGTRVCRLMFKWFICDLLRLYESGLILERVNRDNKEIKIPKRFTYLLAYQQGQSPAPPLLRLLANGPARGKPMPLHLKRLIKEYQWYGIKVGNLRKPDFRRMPTGVDVNSLVLHHAKEDGRTLRYGNLNQWFAKRETGRGGQNIRKSTINDIVELVYISFGEEGKQYFELVKEFIFLFMRECGRKTDLFLQELYRNKNTIPRELWTGSASSSPWIRMLGEAVRQHGGKIIAHDHGYGSGHHDQLANVVIEIGACDEFYTYNKANASAKESQIRPHLILQREPAKVTFPKGQAKIVGNERKAHQHSGTIKTAMYVPTAFHGDRTRLRPVLSDVAYFDWQIRLLNTVRQAGIGIFYKPHPEGASRPPRGFAESLDAKSLEKRFEDISLDVDLYIIDFSCSSTTKRILETNKPVLFVNLGFPQLTEKGKSLLQRRCFILDAVIDTNNRVMVDFEELRRFLRQSEYSMDYLFNDTYYS